MTRLATRHREQLHVQAVHFFDYGIALYQRYNPAAAFCKFPDDLGVAPFGHSEGKTCHVPFLLRVVQGGKGKFTHLALEFRGGQ